MAAGAWSYYNIKNGLGTGRKLVAYHIGVLEQLASTLLCTYYWAF